MLLNQSRRSYVTQIWSDISFDRFADPFAFLKHIEHYKINSFRRVDLMPFSLARKHERKQQQQWHTRVVQKKNL